MVTDVRPLLATSTFAGLEEADDTYNAVSRASDGKIYYVLSSSSINRGGQMYAYDPSAGKVKLVGDLTAICGEAKQKAIPQGKSHVRFYESHRKLYFATHAGYYEAVNGIATIPVHPPEGYRPYPGGHILAYDMTTGEFADLATMPDGQGIITMTMDTERENIFLISWPKGDFFYYEVATGKLKNIGPVCAQGEKGVPGIDYRVLCRSMFVDPLTGSVYLSTAEGDVLFYHPSLPSLQKLSGISLRLDYFGTYDPKVPGSMAYNWRKIVWHPRSHAAYGVHGNSGYLFRFDTRKPSIEVMDRIVSEPSKRSGMFGRFRYGYMGLAIGHYDTLYYFTSGPGDGKENLHLVTYNISDRKYMDHGPVYTNDGFIADPVNSIAIADGYIYTLCSMNSSGKKTVNLLRIPDPFSNGHDIQTSFIKKQL